MYTLKIFVSLFIVIFFYMPINAYGNKSLVVNLISRNIFNEAGKEVDVVIIKEELENQGHHVRLFDYLKDVNITSADINIFLAQFKTNLFSKAKLNWFIPNPDFCVASREDIQKFDLVLCKTEESLRIFQPISQETYYLGFTSLDCHQPSLSKDFSKYLHVAGKSIMKGTEKVLEAWRNHSQLPNLILIKRDAQGMKPRKNVTLITKRVSRPTLLKLQNECGIHLCPSKTEGFGHYIMEAMSAGAVVVTTDAPPMNEFIKDKRCLVKYRMIGEKNYATTYIVDDEELADTANALQQLSYEELQSIGQFNREEYLRRTTEFKKNFNDLMTSRLSR